MARSPALPRSSLFGAILAAGESSRFGQPKQLAALDDHSLLVRAATTARALFGNRHLFVLGAHRGPIMAELQKTTSNVVINRDWSRGPGGSLACAARALPPYATGILIWHVDQPLLTPERLRPLLEAARTTPDRCVCASYADTIGVPAYFPKRMFPALESLPPGQGAKHLLVSESETTTISMPAAAYDVDTPEDLRKLSDDDLPIDR